MRNTQTENIQEHSLQVAIIAHSLAIIRNTYFDGKVNADRASTLALYHDASEIITSDLPTPIKYNNKEIRQVFAKIESQAVYKLLNFLPLSMATIYRDIFNQSEEDKEEWLLVKAADKLSAYIKCLEELRCGNKEFAKAAETIKLALANIDRQEVRYFMDNFIPAFEYTLDEM